MSGRKICVLTGTRADYGHLYWLLKEIQSDKDLELQIVATGTHLSTEFGSTYKVIEQDGFRIDAQVDLGLSDDSAVGIARSIGRGIAGCAEAFARLAPDVLVVLGDRFEILAGAQAAMTARIPIAHLHGGELTEGVIDEAIRHAVTKFSHLHFTAAEPYRRRVIQLGENPKHVLNFGAPGLDYVRKTQLLARAELEKFMDFTLGATNFLVTYHPETLADGGADQIMGELLRALDRFSEAKIIFTKANADSGGKAINALIDKYAARQPERVKALTSMGQLRYLSAVQACDVVVGNSSSGLIEVPVLKKPTVNIGQRQGGRLRADSVIDCPGSTDAIEAAIKKALSPQFQETAAATVSPYGQGNASMRIKDFLKTVSLKDILYKKFHDLEGST